MTPTPQAILEKIQLLLPEFQEKYGIERIGLFGSYIRGEASPGSDIDIIVSFQEDRETFDNYMRIAKNPLKKIGVYMFFISNRLSKGGF